MVERDGAVGMEAIARRSDRLVAQPFDVRGRPDVEVPGEDSDGSTSAPSDRRAVRGTFVGARRPPSSPNEVPVTDRPLRRGVALAALTLACVVAGPAPQLTAALERLYAVAAVDQRRTDRALGGHRPSRGPSSRRPLPTRPAR